STRSAAARTVRTRDCRHAQICGLTYCTVGTPTARSAASAEMLKSGESMPMKTSGRAAFRRRIRSRRSLSSRGRWCSTSASPMTESSSARYHASQPAAPICPPPTPYTWASGTRSLAAAIRPAPSVSPDFSPATSANRLRRAMPGSTRYAAPAVAQRVEQRLELGLLDRALGEHGDRVLELQTLPVHDLVSLADVTDLLRGEAPPLQALGVDAVRLRRTARGCDVRGHVHRREAVRGEERVRTDPAELMDA